MFKLFSILTVTLVLSLFLGLFSLITNSWNRIKLNNSSAYLEYGLWLLCPNDHYIFSSFIFDQKNCIQFNQKYVDKNVLSAFMQDKSIVDLEPGFMDFVQIFYLIGTCFLFLSTLITISILVYLAIKFDDPDFYLDRCDKFGMFTNQAPQDKLFTQSILEFSLVKIHLRILLVYLFIEFILRLVAVLVFTISSEQYLDLVAQKSYLADLVMERNLQKFTNQKSCSYWLCLVSIFLSFLCQILVLVYQIVNYLKEECHSKRTRVNSSIKSNIMLVKEKKNCHVMTRSNLLSIEPIEVSEDLLSKCDYNLGKTPTLASKLFFIDNDHLRYYNRDSVDRPGSNSSLSQNRLFESVKNLEQSILLDSDNQLNYITKLENMLNDLYSASAKNTLRSENLDFKIFLKSQSENLRPTVSTVSLPNLNAFSDYPFERNFERLIIREKFQ
ncbi:hypothetical protein BpHYR1_032595 [Brachionus plicatilis]|uniref:Uncharacterized protein n=1 Tax=Brachionus plicatilis TaxID=10195 RepID=A0A3M7QZD2_BRAPC|nr:hypothetical protein BpHYR1_032595 [Brachionus plicatilis]